MSADLAGVVVGEDPLGDAPVAARRLLVAVDAHLERDDGAFRRQGDARLVAPVDDADRQVEQEIDDARRVVLVGAADQTAERPPSFGPMPARLVTGRKRGLRMSGRMVR